MSLGPEIPPGQPEQLGTDCGAAGPQMAVKIAVDQGTADKPAEKQGWT